MIIHSSIILKKTFFDLIQHKFGQRAKILPSVSTAYKMLCFSGEGKSFNFIQLHTPSFRKSYTNFSKFFVSLNNKMKFIHGKWNWGSNKNAEIKENEQLTFWKQNMPFILVPDSVTNENKNKKMKWDFPRQTNVNANVLLAQLVRSHHQNKKNLKKNQRWKKDCFLSCP